MNLAELRGLTYEIERKIEKIREDISDLEVRLMEINSILFSSLFQMIEEEESKVSGQFSQKVGGKKYESE